MTTMETLPFDIDAISDVTSDLTSVPSSPLSSALSSPEPPAGFFLSLTPPPSQHAEDDMPPARKRRKIEPKVRTTRHLDLTSDTAQSVYDQREATELLCKALRKRRKIVVIAGAGISVSAGIPDFRSSHGLFKSLRGEHKLKGSGKQLFDAAVYKDDDSTAHFHDMVRKLSTLAQNAKPTVFHRLLARLSVEERLLRLYTQNVDGIDTSFPPLATTIPLNHKAPWPQTVQLHGGLEKMMCQKCRHILDFDASLFQGPRPPSCPECVVQDSLRTTHAGKRSHGIGRLRPRMVLYNEHNPDEEAIGAVTAADFRTRPDAVVVVGTSMKIPAVRRIVREMCSIVRGRKEGTTIWINHDSAPLGKDLEDCWDLIVKGDCDEVAQIIGLKEWDDTSPDIVESYTEAELEIVKSSQGELSVEIPPSPEKPGLHTEAERVMAITPPLSHRGEDSPNPPNSMTFKKSTPLKLTLKMPTKDSIDRDFNLKPLKNPASEGRKLTDVLGNKENKPKPTKSKTSTKKRPPTNLGTTKPAPTQVQMHTFGKVSKPRVHPVAKPIKTHEPLSPNANPQFIALQEKDPGYSSIETSPAPETPEAIAMMSWRNQETITPPRPPADMVKLLN